MKTNLTEQEVLAGTWQKRSIHALWKKGQAKQTCKDVVRLCREKIRRAKLELNLGTTIKDDKNVCVITSTVKGGLRKISSFIGCRGKEL